MPLFFFRESSPRFSNRKGCPPKIFQNQISKSQIARGVPLGFFRESSPQISKRKGCPPKVFQRIKFPNLKRQGCPPKILFRESSPQSSSRLLVLLYFSGRRHPNCITLKFGLNYTCGVLRSFNWISCRTQPGLPPTPPHPAPLGFGLCEK